MVSYCLGASGSFRKCFIYPMIPRHQFPTINWIWLIYCFDYTHLKREREEIANEMHREHSQPLYFKSFTPMYFIAGNNVGIYSGALHPRVACLFASDDCYVGRERWGVRSHMRGLWSAAAFLHFPGPLNISQPVPAQVKNPQSNTLGRTNWQSRIKVFEWTKNIWIWPCERFSRTARVSTGCPVEIRETRIPFLNRLNGNH